MMARAFYIILGVYVILYLFVLNKYIAPSYEHIEYFWYIPTIALGSIFILVMFVKPVERILDKGANIKIWTIIAIMGMVACDVLQVLGKRGFWGSYPTLGLTFASVVLVMHFTHGKLSPGKALLLGCGCAWLAEGIQEGIYKSGFLLYHDYPGGATKYYEDLARLVFLWVAFGIVVMAILGKNLAHSSTPFIACATMVALLTSIWFLTGFKTIHFYFSDDYLIQLLSRGWRGACCLTPALLFIPKRIGGG